MIKKIGLIVLTSTILTIQGFTHDFWIHSSSYTPSMDKLGAVVNLYVGNGHIYPIDESFEGKAEFKIIQSDNKEKIIEEKLLGYKEILKKDGNYIVSGKTNPVYWTQYFDDKGNKTWKLGTKEDVKDVISSKQTNKFAKAILSVGKAKDEDFSRNLGQTLEIIPIQNPNKLNGNGEYLTVKVLFKNEPLSSSDIVGTYSGFSNNGDYAFSTSTNEEGIARIKLNHSGYWMLKIEHSEEAPRELQDKVDKISYTATLTFQVQ